MKNGGNNNGGGIFYIILKILSPFLIMAGYSLARYFYNKATKTPGSKSETVEQVKEEFKTGHDWGMPPSDSCKNEKSESLKSKAQYLLFGMFFRICEICCIVGAAGICKTLLACFIAKHSPFQKVVYFDLDDGYNQKERFEKIPKINPVYLPEFMENLSRLRKMSAGKCGKRAKIDKIFTFPASVEDRKQKLMSELGIKDLTRIDKLFLFDIYLEEAISNGAEMIILDSLSDLLATWQMSWEYLDAIFSRCREKRITFLVLHHVNKKGEMSGSNQLRNMVDSLLFIQKVHGNIRKFSFLKDRKSDKKEYCLVKMSPDGPDAANFEVCDESETQSQSVYLSPLEKRILDFLGDKDTITRSELLSNLGGVKKNSVNNCLKNLENYGFITKADGRTWEIINSCHKQFTVSE